MLFNAPYGQLKAFSSIIQEFCCTFSISIYFFIIQVFVFGISGTTCTEKSSQMWNSVKIDYCKTGIN